ALDAPGILRRRVAPLGTEFEVARDALVGMKTIRLSNRELTLPGLTRHTDLVLKVLAEFKDKKKRNFQPLMYAKKDDIVIEPLRPEQFSAGATPTILDNWIQAGLVVGETPILPSVTQVADAATEITVDDDEIFIFTDFIEAKPAIKITAIQAEIDGTKFQPQTMRLAMNESDLQMYELDYPWIADVSIDVDAKVEYAGDSELTPLGVHICLGKLIADIT
ncbi:unnamed protein product, partial [marine sediment metagenome]